MVTFSNKQLGIGLIIALILGVIPVAGLGWIADVLVLIIALLLFLK